MSSQNNIVMDISTMFTGLKGDSKQKLDNVAKLFAKTFDKFAKPFGINIDKNSIKNIEDLEKKFRELGVTATQVGKTISLSMKAADGKFLSTSFDYEGGKAGSGKAKFTQGAVVQSTSYLKPTEQLQRNYENLIKARKELASLEEKGYSKDTETWRQAEESAKNYKEQLYATIEALKERYKLSVDIDREKDIISWGDGKGQLETMGRKYQHSMDYSAAKQQDTAAMEEQARIRQENTRKVREYVSALKEQWAQENKLAVLQQSKAPQNQIQQQQKIVDMAREHTDVLKQQVQGTEEYKEIEEQLTYAQEKQRAKQLELNKTTKKSVSLFGNFQKTLKQVISAGLSWKIFSAITQSFKEMYTIVIELDGALVDLQMVMGSTREEAKELLLEYSNMAQQLGATTQEIASQAVEWQRQGYSAEETNTLIHNSTVLAKVGMLEEAEAQEYLTSAMKGYQVSVEDSIKIVDQLTAIDLEAAVSAGGLAEAMSRTANSAQMAGVEMNELLGYLAVVGETTQKSMSSIGESFKTIFARFGNIKAGKFVDDETGEDLNDVAKVLGEFGIELYDTQGNMRDVNDILIELSSGWENYNDVQKNALATAIAGTRQYENFIVLMNNFGKAQEYAATAAGASGTAMEKFAAYTEGIEAKTNALKATIEELALKLLNSETIITLIEKATTLVGFLADNVWILEGVLKSLVALGILKSIQAVGSGIAGLRTKLIGLTTNFRTLATQNKNMLNTFGQVALKTTTNKVATQHFASSLNALGISTANVSAQEAKRQLQSMGLWTTLKGLDVETQKLILQNMGYSATTVEAIVGTTGWTGANGALKLSLHGVGIALKGVFISNPVGAILTIASTIMTVVSMVDQLTTETEELEVEVEEIEESTADLLSNLSQELSSATSTLEQATQALEDNLEAINKLESKPTLTYVEQKELDNLKEATGLLEEQAAIAKQERLAAAQEYSNVVGSTYAHELHNTAEYDFNSLYTDFTTGSPSADLYTDLQTKLEDNAINVVALAQLFDEQQYYTTEIAALIRTAATETLKEFQGIIDSINSLSEEEREIVWGYDWETTLANAEMYRDALMKLMSPEDYEQIKFTEIYNSEELAEVRALIDSLGESGQITAEDLTSAYSDIGTVLQGLGLDIDTFVLWINSQGYATTQATESLEELTESLNEMQKVYSDLISVVDEYNSLGYLTYDTWAKLIEIEDEYLAVLVAEDGQIKTNTDAIYDLIGAKVENITLTRLEQYVENLVAAAADGTLKSLLNLTDGLDANTQARIDNMFAIIMSNSALAQNAELIFSVMDAMLQMSNSISLGGGATQSSKKATEDWEKVLAYANKTLDDHIDKLEKEKEEIIKGIEEKIKAKEKEIELLEAEKEALKEKNDEKNKEIELEELQRNLQKARQRSMRVYRAELDTWVWEQDPEAVKKAEQELDDYYTEQEIENIEDRIEALEDEIDALEKSTDESEDTYDKRLKLLDEQITKAEEYKNKWNNVKKEYEHAQNEIVAKAKLGADAEKGILEGRIKEFNTFKTGYTKALGEVATATEKSARRINTALSNISFTNLYKTMMNATSFSEFYNKPTTNIGFVSPEEMPKVQGIYTGKEYYKVEFNGKVGFIPTSEASFSTLPGGRYEYSFDADTKVYSFAYASGTLSAQAGLANVDEKGKELIVPKKGRYRMMEYGDGVVPHNLTQKLFEVATNPIGFIANALSSLVTPSFMTTSNQTSNSSIINIGNIELPSVTNGNSFVKQLQLISANR